MEIIGYKCFNNDMTNRYGMKFDVGKIYLTKGIIKFGINGNGFHLCKNIEDTLRYFDAMNNPVNICIVKGSKNIVNYYDEYNGYYDMFAVEQIEILKKLTRKEIIDTAIDLNDIRIKRFISGYRLNRNEINLFKEKFKNCNDVLDVISYYQEEKLDVYTKKRG